VSYKNIIGFIGVSALVFLLVSSAEKPGQSFKTNTVVEKHIVWDAGSLKKVSSAGDRSRAGYARMIQLKDKSLFCVYETAGSTVAVQSKDLGATWSPAISLAARHQGINMAVPDLIQLKSGRLIVFYNSRPFEKSPDKKFGIMCKISDDNGESWSAEKVLYEADWKFENGCWEPSAIQLPTGEVQLYFANESDYRYSNEQNISMITSSDDGNTWNQERKIVSFRKGSRDGMPVPLVLKNQREIVFAIEDNGFENFKPYIIRNEIKNEWSTVVDGSSEQRNYALAEKIADKIYAGAPYLRQLKSGETILSYQGAEGRENNLQHAEMKVVIGDANARNFSSKSAPFIIPPDKYCLWNSLAILDDDTIVAIGSTNAFGNRGEIWMIKGRLVSGVAQNEKPLLMADPTIFSEKGIYYLYGTSSNRGFETYTSKDLKHWIKPSSLPGGMVLKKGDAFGNGGFWAPQVFKRNGLYYMAYTADEQIAIATSKSPMGPFKQKVLKSLSGTGKQIDPFIYFDANGKVYLYHVKLQNGNRIFVAEMKQDLSDVIPGTEKECIAGTELWENTERTGWPVTEGPTVIKHKDLYYLIYSANDFRSKDYAVGYATSTTPTGPWVKYAGNPIISRETVGLNGSGHGDVFEDGAGNLNYVLHVHYSDLKVSPRATAIIGIKFQKVTGRADILTADSKSFKLLKLN
jgi:hypothetical protein